MFGSGKIQVWGINIRDPHLCGFNKDDTVHDAVKVMGHHHAFPYLDVSMIT